VVRERRGGSDAAQRLTALWRPLTVNSPTWRRGRTLSVKEAETTDLIDRVLVQPPRVLVKCMKHCDESDKNVKYHMETEGVTMVLTAAGEAEVIGAEVTTPWELMHRVMIKGVTVASDAYQMVLMRCDIAESPVGSTCVSVASNGDWRALSVVDVVLAVA
jgi:hypothetical protein